MKPYATLNDDRLDHIKQEIFALIETAAEKVIQSIDDANNVIDLSTAENPFVGIDENTIKRRDVGASMFSKYLAELKSASELLCASTNRKELFEAGYAWPDPEYIADNDLRDEVRDLKDSPEKVHEYFHTRNLELPANISDDTTREIVAALCNVAQDSRKGKFSKNYQKLIYLTGEIGQGKSIYINYLLSKYMNRSGCNSPPLGA